MLLTWLLITLTGLSPLAHSQAIADPVADDTEPHIHGYFPPVPFPSEGPLRKNVDFWVRIYGKYTTYQGLIHDAKHIDRIYEVLDFSGQSSATKSRRIRESKRHWREVLLAVHRKQKDPAQLTGDERKVWDLYSGIDEPNRFLNGAHRKRLRFQLGQRDRFIEGLKYSGRYLPVMEAIFRREGLPMELTRLPFVESSFNLRARSKVGASGIWQFMRSTGRLFMRINEAVDERNDPVRATEAAARLLRLNYDSLRSWPLAITAYNHGRKGMMRAVRKVGSEDLEDVVADYRGRNFGFASSNFYAEFLAAVEVERDSEIHFGKVVRDGPLPYYEVKIPDYVSLRDLTRYLKLDGGMLGHLNPGLADSVILGKSRVPAGYQLRIPFDGQGDRDGAARIFQAGYLLIPPMFKHKGQDSYGTGGATLKPRGGR